MKRWLVGSLVLVISFFGLVGNLAVRAQVNVNQTSEEYAGAAEKDEAALAHFKLQAKSSPRCQRATFHRQKSTLALCLSNTTKYRRF